MQYEGMSQAFRRSNSLKINLSYKENYASEKCAVHFNCWAIIFAMGQLHIGLVFAGAL